MIKIFRVPSEIPPEDGISYALRVIQRGVQVNIVSEAECEIVEIFMFKVVGLIEWVLSVLGALGDGAPQGSLLGVVEIGEFGGVTLPVTVQLHEALHLLNHLSI